MHASWPHFPFQLWASRRKFLVDHLRRPKRFCQCPAFLTHFLSYFPMTSICYEHIKPTAPPFSPDRLCFTLLPIQVRSHDPSIIMMMLLAMPETPLTLCHFPSGQTPLYLWLGPASVVPQRKGSSVVFPYLSLSGCTNWYVFQLLE